MSKLNEYAENVFHDPMNGIGHVSMVIKGKRNAFIAGFQLGAEFSEWANMNDWYCIKYCGQIVWLNEKINETKSTTELTEIFLTEKMKEK